MTIASIITFFVWATLGHIFAATVLYFNHRLVFHGTLGRLPLLKRIRKLHTIHHRDAFSENVAASMETPVWGKIALAGSFLFFEFIVAPGFGFGMLTFAGVYATRHRASHSGDTSHFALHHLHHHRKASVNFAGVYPVFDRVFGTHEDY